MRKLTIEGINSRKPENSRLTALYFDGYITYKNSHPICAVVCQCICGNIKRTGASIVALGRAKSCGCLDYDNKTTGMRKYKISTTGEYKSLYHSFHSMMTRCYKKTGKYYRFYGGRGVRVCKEWKYNYDNFAEWSIKNGWKKGLQLDKDKLVNGLLYSPETCCWISVYENAEYKGMSTMATYSL